MRNILCWLLCACAIFSTVCASQEKTLVYVVPVHGEISTAQFFIIRRALKEAAGQQADVVLDMRTPGGALSDTLSIMNALAHFKGATLTYVNAEAISAGSFIAVATDEIWFAPTGVMGAAEAVSSTGEGISEAMRRKLTSFLAAKVRSLSEKNRYRADVQRAMMDPDFVFKIGETMIKPEKELLSLTASEAVKTYGEPPETLLAEGIADNVDALLDKRYGAGQYEKRVFELTGAEQVAVWLRAIAPVLLAAGMFLVYIEFKTPGFGAFGIVGGLCLLLYFAGNYLAGLAGYEPFLLFGLGLLLMAAELYFLQGMLLSGIAAVVLLIVAIVWSGADLWPEGIETVSWDAFGPAFRSLVYAVLLAGGGIWVASRILPKRLYRGPLVLDKALASEPVPEEKFPPIGSEGMVISALRPEGEVEIDGKRYPARARIGALEAGTAVVVVSVDAFAMVVGPRG